ncbi:MAG: penicillin acylase family protein, partial [Noviherbaspirillum sp.]|nr:penicillin acylase family protein [Noviherbaspirillum sp.]
ADDAHFALGFVHAQDRLWQLELNRRIAAGRMAEILGPGALDTDRFIRTLGVRRNAERILVNLSPQARAALEFYARGINAYLNTRSGPLPPEFIITGAPAPAPWHPADSLGWQTMMAWDLSANWGQELLRMRLAQRFSLGQINELLPPYPGDPILETQDYTGLYRGLRGLAQQLSKVAASAPPSLVDGMGSNNWLVGGALSETGKPLLANDPHLFMSAPSLWYLAHMSAPGLNVIGATLPGLPMVVLGRNDRIAWGFTNTAPDVQDLFVERVNPDNIGQYRTPDGWANFALRKETIKVKGQPDVTIDVRESRHGPIVTGALPALAKAPIDAKSHVIAFSWTALRADDLTLQAGIRFNHANNWEEFLDAARDFGAPQQNIGYADVDGNIGFIAPGRIPLRKPENDLKGLAPAPGWDTRYDWSGFMPFNELPRAYNPASQRIVSANEKIVGPDYPHFLTSEWSLPYRADRINALLDARSRHSIGSFEQMQQDHVSRAAQELLPVLRGTAPRSDRAKTALNMLAAWNGEIDARLAQPLIFNAWMREASRMMFADELGEDLMKDYWDQRNVHLPMVNVLKNREGQGRWCADDTVAPGKKPQDCGELLSSSLESALNDLERRYGSDMARWNWGEAHVARSEHRPFGRIARLAPFFDIRIPTSGDTYTVNVGRFRLSDEKEPFASRHAATFRAIYDLSDPENSRFIHSTGQSGNALSPLYRSYVQRWAEVRYLPMKTRRADVEKHKLGLLTISP